MPRLSLLDLGFFITESTASPKHVAGLLVFERPAKAPAGFVRQLYTALLGHTKVKPPFNRVIRLSMSAMPHWQDVGTVDLGQHLFYHRLERGENDRKALYRLVARLHTPMLDRSRPLWEVHVIDGIENGRFALYQKMHHAYADGVTLVRWAAESLAATEGDLALRPIWTQEHSGRRDRESGGNQELLETIWKGAAGAGRRVLGLGRLATMLALESANLTKNAIALPFIATEKTPLTGTVAKGRQFASAAISMDRVNLIRKRTRSTLNHVALTCLDGALRRYLEEHGYELERPITIQMPVSLRPPGEKRAGNKIGIIQVELSPPTDDPYVRLRNIGFSLRGVRNMVDNVAPEAIESYTVLSGLVAMTAETLNLSDTLPPMSNTLVSNVPGPKEVLYLAGAKMTEMHPISTLPPSNLLNITLVSYADQLFFGLIGTNQVSNLDHLSAYVQEAFTELEDAVLDAHTR
jgi:WS/DGAT/MGAT family acyltransferase